MKLLVTIITLLISSNIFSQNYYYNNVVPNHENYGVPGSGNIGSSSYIPWTHVGAYWEEDNPYGFHATGGSYDNYLHDETFPGSGIACSPKSVKSNIEITEKSLEKMISSERFKNEKVFIKLIKDFKNFKSDKKKLAAFMSLVNVFSPIEIAHFVGARKSEYQKYEKVLIKNTSIDPILAAEVVAELVYSLK